MCADFRQHGSNSASPQVVSSFDIPPTTMLAARVGNSTSPCEPPTFSCIEVKTVKVPSPLPGEALVRVNVSSVNPSDVDIVKGASAKLFGTLGVDFAGVVVAKGALCSLEVDDAVCNDRGVPTGNEDLKPSATHACGPRCVQGAPRWGPTPSMPSWYALSRDVLVPPLPTLSAHCQRWE